MASRHRVQRKRIKLDNQRIKSQTQARSTGSQKRNFSYYYPQDHEWGTPVEIIKQKRAHGRARAELKATIQSYEAWRQTGIEIMSPWLAALKQKHREIEHRTKKFLHLFVVIGPTAPITATSKRRQSYHLQIGSIHDRGPIDVIVDPGIKCGHTGDPIGRCICQYGGRYRSLRAFQYQILLPHRAELSSTFGICGCSYDAEVPLIVNYEPGTSRPSPHLNLEIVGAGTTVRAQIKFVNQHLHKIPLLDDPSILAEFKDLVPPGVSIGLGYGFYHQKWCRSDSDHYFFRNVFDLAIGAEGGISEYWTQSSHDGYYDIRRCS